MDTYLVVSLVFLVLAVLFLIVSLVMFFKYDIIGILDTITGSKKRRNIKRMHEQELEYGLDNIMTSGLTDNLDPKLTETDNKFIHDELEKVERELQQPTVSGTNNMAKGKKEKVTISKVEQEDFKESDKTEVLETPIKVEETTDKTEILESPVGTPFQEESVKPFEIDLDDEKTELLGKNNENELEEISKETPVKTKTEIQYSEESGDVTSDLSSQVKQSTSVNILKIDD